MQLDYYKDKDDHLQTEVKAAMAKYTGLLEEREVKSFLIYNTSYK